MLQLNRFYINLGDGATWPKYQATTAKTYGVGWHHLVITNNVAQSLITFYLNGEKENTGTGGAAAAEPAKDCWIGRDVQDNNQTWDDIIGELAIWKGLAKNLLEVQGINLLTKRRYR